MKSLREDLIMNEPPRSSFLVFKGLFIQVPLTEVHSSTIPHDLVMQADAVYNNRGVVLKMRSESIRRCIQASISSDYKESSLLKFKSLDEASPTVLAHLSAVRTFTKFMSIGKETSLYSELI